MTTAAACQDVVSFDEKEELRLNRALAGYVYLGSAPLVLTKTGLAIGVGGTLNRRGFTRGSNS